MPFAFADIEMMFDETLRAADWIFKYGNSALGLYFRQYLETFK